MHLVSEWREFRPDYYDLGVLRTRLTDGIPLLGASATLDAKTLEVVQDRCGFYPDTRIIKTALDRPEIYIQISALLMPVTTMLDLQWVLPVRANSPLDIPKTIIFMDSIKAINNACALMRVWMNQLSYPTEATCWVAPFFSDMASTDKTRIAARFRLPSEECVSPRILIATDAYGLGVDNPDVKRIVQWLLPSTIPKLYQRMGRAMRCGQGQAHFTLLHPPWCIGPRSGGKVGDLDNLGQVEGEEVSGMKKQGTNHKDADRRRDMVPGQWELINAPSSGDCVRSVGLRFFEDEIYRTPAYVKPHPCCSGCDPDFQTSTASHNELTKAPAKDSLRRPWVTRQLREWREKKALALFPDRYLGYCPSLLMPDSILNSLADWAEYIHDEPTMRRWVGGAWAGTRKYHAEIVPILERGYTMSSDRGEVFEEWRRYNDLKRKRITDPDVNTARVDFDGRRTSWLTSSGYDKVLGRTTDQKGAKQKQAKKTNLSAKNSMPEQVLDKAQPPALDHQPEGLQSPSSSTQTAGMGVGKQAAPRRPRQALQEVTSNTSRDLSPSRIGRARKFPARLGD